MRVPQYMFVLYVCSTMNKIAWDSTIPRTLDSTYSTMQFYKIEMFNSVPCILNALLESINLIYP